MPVAIVLSEEGRLPGLFAEATTEALPARLLGLSEAPALPNLDAAHLSLTGLPELGRWFDNRLDALNYHHELWIDQPNEDMIWVNEKTGCSGRFQKFPASTNAP